MLTVSCARLDTPQRKLERRIPFHLGRFSLWIFKHLTKISPLISTRVFSWENDLQESTLQGLWKHFALFSLSFQI
jgi:hypothetical protein